MTRERGKANRGAAAKKASVQTHQARVLEIAKWPEWEQEQLRDIAEWDEVASAESASHFVREDQDKTQQAANAAKWEETVHSESSFREERDEIQRTADIAKFEETVRSESSSQPPPVRKNEQERTCVVTRWDESEHSQSPQQPFHGQQDKRESGEAGRIVAGIVAGVLLVGAGIYAHERLVTRLPAPQATASKTAPPGDVFPARPLDIPALALPAVPGTLPAPPHISPDNSLNPSHLANNSNARTQHVPPLADDPINAPMTLAPGTAPPPQQPVPASQAAIQQAVVAPLLRQSSEAGRTAFASDPINAPMTLTPETAPPPQDAVPTGQAAMQQPAVTPFLRQSSEAGRTAFASDPIDAPMTLTPETAPPPQPLMSPSQTGLQQPAAPPLVPGQTAQPLPAR